MRLATVLHDGRVRVAARVDDELVRLLDGQLDLLELVGNGLPMLLAACERDGPLVAQSQRFAVVPSPVRDISPAEASPASPPWR
jgi:hypothetical protein